MLPGTREAPNSFSAGIPLSEGRSSVRAKGKAGQGAVNWLQRAPVVISYRSIITQASGTLPTSYLIDSAKNMLSPDIAQHWWIC